MRCFIAVELPASLKRRIERALENLRKNYPHLKWVKEENLHITLKFLGEVSEDRLEGIKNVLNEISKKKGSFELKIGEIGSFPPKGNIRVLFLSVEKGGEELKRLADSVEREMAKLGFEREDREFVPHLTVARWKRGTPPVNRDNIDLKSFSSPAFKVSSLALFESILRPEGPIYRKIAEFKLKNE